MRRFLIRSWLVHWAGGPQPFSLLAFSLNASQRRGCTAVKFTLWSDQTGVPHPWFCKGGDFDFAFPCLVESDTSPETIAASRQGHAPRLFQSEQPSVPTAPNIPNGNSFPARTAEPSLCVTNRLLIQMPRSNNSASTGVQRGEKRSKKEISKWRRKAEAVE